MKDNDHALTSSRLNAEQLKALAGKLTAHSRMIYVASPEVHDGELTYTFRPRALPSPNGFIIRLTTSDSRVITTLELDDFAGELIRFMVMNLPQTSGLWKEVISRQIANGSKVGVEINGEFLVHPESLPKMNWDSFYISWMAQLPQSQSNQVPNRFAAISRALLQVNDLVGCILPFDEDAISDELVVEEALEGGKSRVTHNKYERSRANRTACIALFGTVCGVCGFDFEERYGEIGAEFIEVHHITPVSQMGGEYSVSPVTDLIPLCSNCHSMAHTKLPPWTPSELQSKIK